eukprot:1178086-Prorocentrum_minimum.AAC.3
MSTYKTPKDVVIMSMNAALIKASLRVERILALGFMAGAYISLGALGGQLVVGGMTSSDEGSKKLANGAIFPLGLILVLIAGGGLYTGNTAIMAPNLVAVVWSVSCVANLACRGTVVPARAEGLLYLRVHRHKTPVASVPRADQRTLNWSLLYISNFAGAATVAYFLAFETAFFEHDPYREDAKNTAKAMFEVGWGEVLLRGIAANWLVSLAIWLSYAANDIFGKGETLHLHCTLLG